MRRRIRGVDTKSELDPLACVACVARVACAACRACADHGAHGHMLAGVERLVGHEAGAAALRVAGQVAVVAAGLRADDRHLTDVGSVRTEEADLGVRVGRVAFRLRRDVDSRGERRAVFEGRRQAVGRGPRRGCRAPAREPEIERAADERRDDPCEERDQQDDVPVASHVCFRPDFRTPATVATGGTKSSDAQAAAVVPLPGADGEAPSTP